MSQLTQAFPDKSFSGIGGISTFEHALNYFLLGCGTVQVCTAAMLDHAIGPNIIKGLNDGLARFLEKHADKGWTTLDDFVGLRRDRVVLAVEDPPRRREGVPRRLRARRLRRAGDVVSRGLRRRSAGQAFRADVVQAFRPARHAVYCCACASPACAHSSTTVR